LFVPSPRMLLRGLNRTIFSEKKHSGQLLDPGRLHLGVILALPHLPYQAEG
jgi:hypothetical protein